MAYYFELSLPEPRLIKHDIADNVNALNVFMNMQISVVVFMWELTGN